MTLTKLVEVHFETDAPLDAVSLESLREKTLRKLFGTQLNLSSPVSVDVEGIRLQLRSLVPNRGTVTASSALIITCNSQPSSSSSVEPVESVKISHQEVATRLQGLAQPTVLTQLAQWAVAPAGSLLLKLPQSSSYSGIPPLLRPLSECLSMDLHVIDCQQLLDSGLS